MSRLETRRFDAKLDSFLRRRLPQEDFERISTSEPCVILSPEDKRVHRHAVLGHRCVYFTEVPPKNLKIALYLKDVTSIRMVSVSMYFIEGSGSILIRAVEQALVAAYTFTVEKYLHKNIGLFNEDYKSVQSN